MKFLLFLAAVGLACTGESTPREHETCAAQLDLEPLFTLPPFEFSAVGLAWSGDSAWVVLDRHDKQGVLLDRDGTERLRFAGEGGGPGEFRAVAGVLVHPDSGFLVGGFGKLAHFGWDGALRAEVTLPGMVMDVWHWDGIEATLAWDRTMTGPMVGRANLPLEQHRELFAPFDAAPELRTELMPGVVNPFQPMTGRGDSVAVVAVAEEYLLLAFDTLGRVQQRMGRPDLGPMLRTDREVAELERSMTETFKSIPEAAAAMPEVAELFRGRPKPHFTTPIRMAPDGSLWLFTQRSADSTLVDVLDSTGAFLLNAALPGQVIDLAFHQDRVALLFETNGGAFDGQHALSVFQFRVRSCR